MGQKTHPYGFRLGYNKPWKSRWYADKDYADLLHEDVKLRRELKDKLKARGISSIDIERAANKLVVRIYTARPGIIIGRKGSEIDKLKQDVQKRTKREVHIDIQEVHRPELDATLVAESGSHFSSKKRVAFRRAQCVRRLRLRASSLRLQGHQSSRSWPLERRGNRPQRVVPARPSASANSPRGHRFRHCGSQHHVRHHRREVLDLSGRKRSEARLQDSERARCGKSGRGSLKVVVRICGKEGSENKRC